MKYQTEVERILAGETLYAVSKEAGVHPGTIHRELVKHPNYEVAKAKGLIRQNSIPKLPRRPVDRAADARAVAEVVAGATTVATAEKYGIPVASLTKLVRVAHPNFSMQYRGKTVEEVLKEKLEKLEAAKAKAARLAEMLS